MSTNYTGSHIGSGTGVVMKFGAGIGTMPTPGDTLGIVLCGVSGTSVE